MTDQLDPDPERTALRNRDQATEPANSPPATTGEVATPASEAGRRRIARVWSNLNLNGPVPARVRPTIGEWGPQGLPSTKHKKRVRWITPVAFVLALCALVVLGWYFWTAFR